MMLPLILLAANPWMDQPMNEIQSSVMDPPAIQKQLERLNPLLERLKHAPFPVEKVEILNSDPTVAQFLKQPSLLRTFLSGLSIECELAVKSVIAIGQGERIFQFSGNFQMASQRLRELLQTLLELERFYGGIGGIVGYHVSLLTLLSAEGKEMDDVTATYSRPEGIDISHPSPKLEKLILAGLEHLPEMAEIYPVGGAADRLRLFEAGSGNPLPAARLSFCGRGLLEGLILDLQAREYLYYKLYGRQLTTPIALMTSQEKENHNHILQIFEENDWFFRPKESFSLFRQPCVPTIDRKGNWCLVGPMKLLLKPGGHGVIWKIARDEGVFDWLQGQGRKKALVRQINNPIAGIDYGLLAFTGLGCSENKWFGFASCLRQVKAAEGVDVLVEKREGKNISYCLTNIEYCDFKKYQIEDKPAFPGSPYSKFSSNTNILFADLGAVKEAVSRCPIPGMLINVKKSEYVTELGEVKEEEIGRLESTMQNIADVLGQTFPKALSSSAKNQLKTFITFHDRHKTISTIKREYALGLPLLETPEGCLWDLLRCSHEVLSAHCKMKVPEMGDEAIYLTKGPSFLFTYHPALGPLFEIIGQKIRGGEMTSNSELDLDIAEVDIENLKLDGSLLVHAQRVMGHRDEAGHLHYSEGSGKCTLKNVTVTNRGIDREAKQCYWRKEIERLECCEIFVWGNGEFYAENVTLSGGTRIEVPNGEKVTAVERGGKVLFISEPIKERTWHWKYGVDKDEAIKLVKTGCAAGATHPESKT